MKRIACVLLLFVSLAQAQNSPPEEQFAPRPPRGQLRLPDRLTTFGWDCVKAELDLTEDQTLAGKDGALRKKLGYTVEWFDSIDEDPELTDQEKIQKIKAVSDQYLMTCIALSTWVKSATRPVVARYRLKTGSGFVE
jgi:hypothetical protein